MKTSTNEPSKVPPGLDGEAEDRDSSCGGDSKSRSPESSDDALNPAADSYTSAVNTDDLFAEVGRLSRLGSDLRDCMQNLIRNINDATDTLEDLRQSIDRKRAELKQLYDIEASADTLKKLAEEQAYLLKKRREEIAVSEKEILERRKRVEAEFDRRERMLETRELEYNRLVRELELLMARLEDRIGKYGMHTMSRD